MKINTRSLEFVNHSAGNRPPPIPFYMPEMKDNLSLSDYQYYEVGTPEEWLQFINAISQVIKGQDIQDLEATYTLVKSLLRGDTLQVFQNKEANQEKRDSPAFMKCPRAITEHVFAKKACKIQKKYIQNIHKPLMLGSCKWILRMIKLNDYLVNFPVPNKVEATKMSHNKFVDVLEDRVPLQWKLELQKEEEAELHKPLAKKIAHAKKEHDKAIGNRKGKHHNKSELCHKRCHGPGKHHDGKHKKKFCNYYGLCHHDTKECSYYQAYRKHVQPTHPITEKQRLWQVCFVKDAERCAKKRSLSAKEVKDLNKFVKDKIYETIKQHDCNMCM
eukprot:15314127-Ditylum_brightwellii.AAC.1